MAVAFALLPVPAMAGGGKSPDHAGGHFAEVGRRVLDAGAYRVTVKLLDGRAHFAHQHAEHPGHAGIPTHRLTVEFQAKKRAQRVPGAADLEVTGPAGRRLETPLWREEGHLVADLELAATGSYAFRLSMRERPSKRILTWTETLR